MAVTTGKATATLFHFGGFTLDLRRHGLYRDGERIHLTPKPLETLIYLVEHSGRPVKKQELMESVWKDTFVTEDTLVHAVKEIRLALGDDKADPRFIQTIPRHGYRFVGEVSPGSPQPEAQTAAFSPRPVGENERGPHRRSLLGEVKRHPGAAIITVSALLIASAGITLWPPVLPPPNQLSSRPHTPFQQVRFTRLTTNGNVTAAAVWPDGRYIMYAVSSEGRESLWLKQVMTGGNVQITAPADVSYQGLTPSPDGNFVYYVAWDKRRVAALYRIPLLGGAAKELVADIDSAITFSPDGGKFAFFRGYPEDGVSAVMITEPDGTAGRRLAALRRPDFFPTLGAAPAWSPDGKSIACPAGSVNAGGRYMTVFEVRAADGVTKPMTPRRWWRVGQVAWLRDGSGLILSAREQASGPFQIWHLSYPGGEARQITNDLSDYLGVSLTADSSALVTLQSSRLSNIWTAQGGGGEGAKQITFGNVDGATGVSWTPDGRIVFVSRVRGNQDIWIMDRNGGHQRQLTVDARDNSWPSVSPDGRYIVFMSNRTGANHIWRMDLDGGSLSQLTDGSDDRWPHCSPDGQWVVYASADGLLKLYKVSIDGGSPVQLTAKEAHGPAVSPDGELIATAYFDDPTGIKLAVYPFRGGEPLKILNNWSFYVRWAPDGRALAYVDQRGVPNIMSQTIDGGPPKQLTHFTSGGISHFDWSRDGRLACSRSTITTDVVLLNDSPVR